MHLGCIIRVQSVRLRVQGVALEWFDALALVRVQLIFFYNERCLLNFTFPCSVSKKIYLYYLNKHRECLGETHTFSMISDVGVHLHGGEKKTKLSWHFQMKQNKDNENSQDSRLVWCGGQFPTDVTSENCRSSLIFFKHMYAEVENSFFSALSTEWFCSFTREICCLVREIHATLKKDCQIHRKITGN